MTGARAGLEVDDEIVAIEGHEVRRMTSEEVVDALRGGVGSTVTLTVERRGVRRDVKVERGPFSASERGEGGKS